MSTYPEVGDYVRVSHEGTVKTVTQHGTVSVLLPNRRIIYFDRDRVSFEKINPPEPEWKIGQVVEDSEECLYVRINDDTEPWLEILPNGVTTAYSENVPSRPLRRLVPEEWK